MSIRHFRNGFERKCVPGEGRKIGYRDSSNFPINRTYTDSSGVESCGWYEGTIDNTGRDLCSGPFARRSVFSRFVRVGEGERKRNRTIMMRFIGSIVARIQVHRYNWCVSIAATVERRHSIDDFQSVDGVGSPRPDERRGPSCFQRALGALYLSISQPVSLRIVSLSRFNFFFSHRIVGNFVGRSSTNARMCIYFHRM